MLRIKLRYKILVSAVPFVAGAIFAGVEAFDSPRPCIAVGSETLEIGSAPWHADLHVSPTDDPAPATVRVALTDNGAEAAFAATDDLQGSEVEVGEVQGSEENACATTPATQFVAVSAKPTAAAPVIHRSQGGPADYRIFVRSERFTPREATALIVGDHGDRP